MTRRVLVAVHDRSSLGILSECLKEFTSEVEFDLAFSLEESVEQSAAKDYGLVLCCVDSAPDLDAVRRIRSNRPDVPILIAPDDQAALGTPSEGLEGPTVWVPSKRDREAIALQLRRLLNLQESGRANQSERTRRRLLNQDMRKEYDEQRKTRERSSEIRRMIVWPRFAPLLIEDDPLQTTLMVRAFEKASVPAPIRVVRTGDEAIAYLNGTAPFEDRNLHPLPTLVILDLHLPGKSGQEVLSWIRASPTISKLPVVVLSSSENTEDIRRAYANRVNSYLVRPPSFDELVEMVRSIHFYWTRVNIAPVE